MNAVQGLDTMNGLDLILHTPGGDPTAAVAIVAYLKEKFTNNIRCIVPQIALSAGTMVACAAKEIIMGRQSSLGPIDPQFSGIPAFNIKSEFEEAKADLAKNPENVQYWAIKLQQYPAAFMKSALDAIDLADQLAAAWLSDCMLKEKNEEEIRMVVNFLNNHENTKVHSRHYNYKSCRENGLKIVLMEDDQKLQDKILGMHHAFMLNLAATGTTKIISNNMGKDYCIASQKRL